MSFIQKMPGSSWKRNVRAENSQTDSTGIRRGNFSSLPENGDTLSVQEIKPVKTRAELEQLQPLKMARLEHFIAILRGTEDSAPFPGANKLDNFARVDETVYRGAMPVSSQQIEKLKKIYNVHTLIDLRGPDTTPETATAFEREWAAHYQIRYVRIPMNSHVPPGVKEIQQLFRAIPEARRDGGKVYVHCKHGIDRTGVMMAAYETKLGRSPQEIYERMKKHGYNLLHKLSRPAQRAFVKGPELTRRVSAAEGQ